MSLSVGVIGGLGPLATIQFMQRVLSMTEASCDQDHVNMIVRQHAEIPDRTAYILDTTKENPRDYLYEDVKALEEDGVQFVVMPCNTVHYFHEGIQSQVKIPVINLVEEMLRYAQHTIPHLKTIGLMATDGTLQTGMYQHAAAQYGYRVITPSLEQQKDVMNMIYQGVKADRPVSDDQFLAVCDALRSAGADIIFLGCTELSVLWNRLSQKREDVLDSLDVLAAETVYRSGKPLSKEGLRVRPFQ